MSKKGRVIRAWISGEDEKKFDKIMEFLEYDNESGTIKKLIDNFWDHHLWKKQEAQRIQTEVKEKGLGEYVKLKWKEE